MRMNHKQNEKELIIRRDAKAPNKVICLRLNYSYILVVQYLLKYTLSVIIKVSPEFLTYYTRVTIPYLDNYLV